MKLNRLLRPTNHRIRLFVGLLLVGLFCVQCTRQTQAVNSDDGLVVAIDGKPVGATSADVLSKVDKLAKTDHIALLEFCLQNYKNHYKDYTCTFIKQERIDGKIKPEQEMSVKFMGKPFSVALAWTKNPPRGDRVIYVEGKYDNKMIVRPTSGFLQALTGGSVQRKPDGPEAMSSTLRPVNMFGFENGLENLLDVYREADKANDLKEEFGGYAEVAGRKSVVLVRYLPAKNDYPAYKTIVYIDLDYLVPIRIEGYGWEKNPELLCRYTYKDMKFNVGLTPDNFLPEANGVKVPK